MPQVEQLDDQSTSRLLLVWEQLEANKGIPDLAEFTAIAMTSVDAYGHSIKMSNVVNDRQGKNRVVYANTSGKLLRGFDESNYDEFDDRTMSELIVELLNEYFADKKVVSSNREGRTAANKVRIVLIQMFCNNLSHLIPSLTIPSYVKEEVEQAMSRLSGSQDSIVEEWLDWMKENESKAIYKIAKENISKLFNPSDTHFNRKFLVFNNQITQFRDYSSTYETYLIYANKYKKVNSGSARDFIYEIFDITPKVASNNKSTVIKEMQDLYSTSESLLLFDQLLFSK